MNKQLQTLLKTYGFIHEHMTIGEQNEAVAKYQKFAEFIFTECINTLEFHGFTDAIPYVNWMITNKFGIKQ